MFDGRRLDGTSKRHVHIPYTSVAKPVPDPPFFVLSAYLGCKDVFLPLDEEPVWTHKIRAKTARPFPRMQIPKFVHMQTITLRTIAWHGWLG